ncbi:MAG: hypothetical protein UT61_C0025G0018 [Candidatus Woesebacteria bacterium GW2011_GWA1_39_8]|uniref:Uncharacterized protein n=1 Tax=Candidatus Woesebacteria bacterium GW2011_GWA1_39_8 TaxID=1618552 RepID=A0A0G0PX47_9BACT|nr:MAG: hypothetical protein UT61_C0025G0018 [Candidatus Woesebacteria bacterium GW2011_GWA1_39_8]
MNSNKEFLKNTQRIANEHWLSADGDDWQGADDDWQGADDDWQGADDEWQAQGASRDSGTSSPYILKIVNACTTAISSVDIGDANNNFQASNNNQNSNITTTINISGFTYNEFLSQTMTKSFKVGQTLIVSSSSGQLNETITVTHRDINGDTNSFTIVPTINENQQQTDRVRDFREYLFDGFTRARFSNIVASGTVYLYFYPARVFAPTQIAAGRPAVKTYRPPVQQSQVFVRSGGQRPPVKRIGR